MKWINRENIFYRFQQLLVLVAHLILLRWMFYTLSEAGSLPMIEVMYHFIGMSIYGGLLIKGTATWAKYHHRKEQQNESSK